MRLAFPDDDYDTMIAISSKYRRTIHDRVFSLSSYWWLSYCPSGSSYECCDFQGVHCVGFVRDLSSPRIVRRRHGRNLIPSWCRVQQKYSPSSPTDMAGTDGRSSAVMPVTNTACLTSTRIVPICVRSAIKDYCEENRVWDWRRLRNSMSDRSEPAKKAKPYWHAPFWENIRLSCPGEVYTDLTNTAD